MNQQNFRDLANNPRLVFAEDSQLSTIIKVGGASLKRAKHIEDLVSFLVRFRPRVLVVSAMKGMTNLLERTAEAFLLGENETAWDFLEAFFSHHHTVAERLGVSVKEMTEDFRREIQEMTDNDAFDPRHSGADKNVENFKGQILSYGERLCAFLVRETLHREHIDHVHIDARDVIRVDEKKDEEGRFPILFEPTKERLSGKLYNNLGRMIIMEGFIASGNRNLGRNGSDTTLALVALTLHEMGEFPRVIYVKGEVFKFGRWKVNLDRSVTFETFKLAIESEGHEQPYIHGDALDIFEKTGIPFLVFVKGKPDYRLVVGRREVNLSENMLSLRVEQLVAQTH